MARIARLWRNREFILCLAIATGLVFGQGAVHTKPLVLPVLGIIMTVSIMGIRGASLRSPGGFVVPALAGPALSYGLFGGLTLALASVLIQDPDLWAGFVILAVIPPGVGIIPFTDMLKGNNTFSMIGSIAGYLAALFLTPLVTVAFLGAGVADPCRLLIVFVQLILAPFVLARLLVLAGLDRRIEPVKGAITNWGFFLVIFTSIGLNRSVFLDAPLSLLPVASIALTTTFLAGWLIEWTGKRVGIDAPTRISLVLFGTMKNYGLAAGLAMTTLNDRAAIPPALVTLFSILFLVVLMARQRARGEARL